MSPVRLNGSTSGYSELSAPAVAGNNTITLPTGAGSANQFLKNGATAGSLGYSSVVEDSSGRLLVGTSTARTGFFNGAAPAQLQIEYTGSGVAEASFVHNENSGNGGVIIIGKSRGTTVGSNTVVQSGDEIGVLDFQAADGTDFVIGARITAVVDGTPGANDMPGRLVFSTTADGASTPTERMRIANDGTLTINAPIGINGQVIVSSNGFTQFHRPSGAAQSTLGFYNGGNIVGEVRTSTTATSYITSSDYRLKENVVPVDDGITRLQQLKPSRFNFIADPDTTVDGFLAHEAQAVVPECVTGTKDAVDADGNPQYQGIDQSKLVPLLTAALQEAIAKIETQGASIAALEARLTALEVTP